jgi:hypothetical protein
LICDPLCRVPQDINLDPSLKSASASDKSPKVDKPPSPQVERTALDSPKTSSPKVCKAPLVVAVLRHLQPVPPRARTLWVPLQCRNQMSTPEHLPQAPGLMDSGLPVGLSIVRGLLGRSLRRIHDKIHGSQSPYGTTQTLSRPDSTSVGS